MIQPGGFKPTFFNQVYEHRSFVIASATISALVSAIFTALAILNIFTLGSALIAGGTGLSAIVLIALYCLKQPPTYILAFDNELDDLAQIEKQSPPGYKTPEPEIDLDIPEKPESKKKSTNLALSKKRKYHKATCHHNTWDVTNPLPDELLIYIFSFLNMRHLSSVQQVCRRWTYCANDPSIQIPLMKARWPSISFPKNAQLLQVMKSDHLGLGFIEKDKESLIIENMEGHILSGHRLICTKSNKAVIYDLKLKKPISSFKHSGHIFAMDLEGDILVTASYVATPFSFQIKVWNINQGRLLKTLRIKNEERIYDVKIHNTLVYLRTNQGIYTWNLEKAVSPSLCISLPIPDHHEHDGHILLYKEYLFVTHTGDKGAGISIYNSKTNEHMGNLGIKLKEVHNCLLVQDNTVITEGFHSVEVWNLESCKRQKTLKHDNNINSVAIQGDLIVTGTHYKLKVWSLKTGECLLTKKLILDMSDYSTKVGIQGDIIFVSIIEVADVCGSPKIFIFDLKKELPHLHQ